MVHCRHMAGEPTEPFKEMSLAVTAVTDRLSAISGGSDTDYFDTINKILTEALWTYDKVLESARDNNLQYAAFGARNILELFVWGIYCSLSVSNAAQFRQDAARDAIGLMQALERFLESKQVLEHVAGALSEGKDSIARFAAEVGVEEDDNNYCRVSAAAVALHPQLGAFFKLLNVALSKVIHPTALLVNYPYRSQDVTQIMATATSVATSMMNALVTIVAAKIPQSNAS